MSAKSDPTDGIFLKNCWYVAAWDHELIDGTKLARTILEKPVVLYKGESGRVVALEDRCCHRGAPLSIGRIEGDCIRCMYHGMKFDPSGKCIQIPGQDMIPPKLGVRSFPVVEHDHLVWIWMGDPAKADPGLIIDYPPLREPGWRGMPAYMHYDANWLLIVDNLSDFAHLAFVHTKTLGGSEEYAYTDQAGRIERLADGFRVERWHMNADAAAVPPQGHPETRPTRSTGATSATCTSRASSSSSRSSRRPAAAPRRATPRGARQYRNCQFMTPETRRTTHFFWNYLHDYDLDDPNIARRCATACSRVSWRTRHHRGAAEAVRRRPRHQAARHRGGRGAVALPLDA